MDSCIPKEEEEVNVFLSGYNSARPCALTNSSNNKI
jgi:hypothetical protein